MHIATAGMNEDKLLIFFNNDILTTFNVTFTDRASKGGEFIKHFTDYKAFRHAIVITVEMRHFNDDNYCFLLKKLQSDACVTNASNTCVNIISSAFGWIICIQSCSSHILQCDKFKHYNAE